MFEKAILILEKKGYSWDLRFQDPDRKEVLMLSYHSEDVRDIDNFMEAFHVYSRITGSIVRYFFGKGPKEMRLTAKSEIMKKINNLPEK